MAQLDFSLGQARTPLNIQPGISNYFAGQANKRANIASKAKQTATQKASKKAQTIAEMVSRYTDDQGQMDDNGFASALLKKGMLSEVTEFKKDRFEQKQNIISLQKQQTEQRQSVSKELGTSFRAVLDSENPVEAFMSARKNAVTNKLPLSEGLLNYFPTDEEIVDGRLNPSVANELDFISRQTSSKRGPISLDDKIKEMDHLYGLKKELARTKLADKADPLVTYEKKLNAAEKFAKRKEARAKKAKLDEWARKKVEGGAYKPPQYKSATYGIRMMDAVEVMEKLYEKGYKRESSGQRIFSILPGEMSSSERRQQDQAETNFIYANLRQESGAAIQASEFTNGAAQYFPRPGDSEQAILNKARNRNVAIAGMRAAAGGAWDEVQGVIKPMEPKTVGKFTKKPASIKFPNDPEMQRKYEAWKKKKKVSK